MLQNPGPLYRIAVPQTFLTHCFPKQQLLVRTPDNLQETRFQPENMDGFTPDFLRLFSLLN